VVPHPWPYRQTVIAMLILGDFFTKNGKSGSAVTHLSRLLGYHP